MIIHRSKRPTDYFQVLLFIKDYVVILIFHEQIKVKSGIFLSLGLCMTTSIRTVRKSTEGRSTQRKCPISNCYYYITYLYLYMYFERFPNFFCRVSRDKGSLRTVLVFRRRDIAREAVANLVLFLHESSDTPQNVPQV